MAQVALTGDVAGTVMVEPSGERDASALMELLTVCWVISGHCAHNMENASLRGSERARSGAGM